MEKILERIEDINKPIVHIAFGFFISSLSYGAFQYSRALSITVILLFLFLEYKFTNKEFLCVVIIVVGLGIGYNINYYNYEIKEGDTIRITSVGYKTIGEVSGRKIVLTNKIKGLKPGQKIVTKGDFTRKDDRETGVIGELKVTSYKILKGDFITNLFDTKEEVREKLANNIGLRKAGLITSIAYGDKTLLDNEDNRDMKLLGVIHAISVSGMHVAIIYLILSKITRREVALIITAIYVIFTGMAFSSIRSLIMLAVMCYGIPFRRNYSPIGGLSFSAIIILIWKPYTCYDIGFLLSYSSTIGIILYNKKFKNTLYKLPKILCEGISLSIASQVFSLPLLIMYFKSISLNILFGNIILIPIINLLMIIGNILPIVVNVEWIFNFISYVLYTIVNFLDYLTDVLYKFSLPLIEMNFYYGKFIIVLIITLFFYKKGFKKSILLPVSYLIIIFIEMYSPFVTIEYFKEGAIAINYRGEGAIITNKRNIDISKIKGETKINEVISDGEEYRVMDGLSIKQYNKDFIIKENKKGSVLLKLSKDNKYGSNYDIIDFEKSKVKKIIVIRGKFFRLY
ncbi:MAG: ComEC/Rec2 family competence protein [Clostridium sp.]